MGSYKIGINRDQGELFPSRLEDYIHEDNPVRAIDVYIDSLNLDTRQSDDEQSKKRSSAGQPAYSPSTLLKLYLYGYINRVRSSRALEKECKRNIEVMWLLTGLSPCYKTIADFRKNHSGLLQQVHKDFILLCKQLALLGGDCVAIDGSFFNGNVSDKSFITDKGLKQSIQKLDEKISHWLSSLDEQDRKQAEQAEAKGNSTSFSEKLAELKQLQARKQEKERQLKQLTQAGKTQQSRTDADARLLHKRGQTIAGYNIQIAVDSKHKLVIADKTTTDANDLKQLSSMSKAAKDVLKSPKLDVLADAGYYSAVELVNCIRQGITPYVPNPLNPKRATQAHRYPKAQFRYDPKSDSYHCPAGELLTNRQNKKKQSGSFIHRYAASETACLACRNKAACITPKSRCREIWRNEHEPLLEQHQQRMESSEGKMKRRGALVEHPFGTLKRRGGWDHFLVRGLTKVRGEWSLMAFAYNFTRVLNILGSKAFKQHCMDLIFGIFGSFIRKTPLKHVTG